MSKQPFLFLKILLIAIILALFIFLAFKFFFISQKKVAEPVVNNISDTLYPTAFPDISAKDVGAFKYNIIPVLNNFKIELIPNFTQKDSVSKIMENHQCVSAVNSGFYNDTKEPIGLFYIKENKLSDYEYNTLFNGFIWKKNGITQITSSLPPNLSDWAVQTGPLFYESGVKRFLTIKDDEMARRTVAYTTNESQLYFLTIYEKSDPFKGPYLADIPEIIGQIAENEDASIKSAINLDGGNHSAFITNTVKLMELAAVGSIFCIK